MKRKIVFFDIDGTLVTEDPDHILPISTVYSIQQLRRNGHYAFINSGRTLFNVIEHDYILKIGFDGYICGCGTHIVYRGKDLLYKEIPEELHPVILNAARKCHMEIMYEGRDYFYFDMQQSMCEPRKRLYDNFSSHRKDAESADKHFSKFVTWETPESNTKEFIDILSPWFDYIDRGGGFGEVCLKGYTKATGIQFLCDTFGLSNNDCFAIGDSMNDLPMLDYVPHSILMGNGTPSLFSHVEYVTTDILKDGICNALEHYELI